MNNTTTNWNLYPTAPAVPALIQLHAHLATEVRNCTKVMDSLRLAGDRDGMNAVRDERTLIEDEMMAVAEMLRRRT